MQKKLIILIYIFIFGCSLNYNTSNTTNDIIIFSSKIDRDLIETSIDNLFSNIIYTPQPEREFNIIFKDVWELEQFKKSPNIIIISLNEPNDSTGDLLMSKFTSTYKINKPIYILKDLFVDDQLTCIINVKDTLSLFSNINDYKNWIIDEFRINYNKRMKDFIYSKGINKKISNKIYNYFGYNIEIQPDYKIIKEDSLNSFLWIGRGYPYRWLVFHKRSNIDISNIDSFWDNYISDYKTFMPDINISSHFRKYEKILDKYNIMRGIYDHKESQTGGPFFVYIFESKINNEVILVSGFVNNPGNSKIHLLKQLENLAFNLDKGDIE